MIDSIGGFVAGLADQLVAFPGALLRDLSTLDLQGLSETLFSTAGLFVLVIVAIFILLLRPSKQL